MRLSNDFQSIILMKFHFKEKKRMNQIIGVLEIFSLKKPELFALSYFSYLKKKEEDLEPLQL